LSDYHPADFAHRSEISFATSLNMVSVGHSNMPAISRVPCDSPLLTVDRLVVQPVRQMMCQEETVGAARACQEIAEETEPVERGVQLVGRDIQKKEEEEPVERRVLLAARDILGLAWTAIFVAEHPKLGAELPGSPIGEPLASTLWRVVEKAQTCTDEELISFCDRASRFGGDDELSPNLASMFSPVTDVSPRLVYGPDLYEKLCAQWDRVYGTALFAQICDKWDEYIWGQAYRSVPEEAVAGAVIRACIMRGLRMDRQDVWNGPEKSSPLALACTYINTSPLAHAILNLPMSFGVNVDQPDGDCTLPLLWTISRPIRCMRLCERMLDRLSDESCNLPLTRDVPSSPDVLHHFVQHYCCNGAMTDATDAALWEMVVRRLIPMEGTRVKLTTKDVHGMTVDDILTRESILPERRAPKNAPILNFLDAACRAKQIFRDALALESRYTQTLLPTIRTVALVGTISEPALFLLITGYLLCPMRLPI
jgi:hypothetical protein